MYKRVVPARPLPLSEARRRLSALVERVACGGAPVAIGRYGRERAVLVGAEHYARLAGARRAASARLNSLEGSLVLECSPAELIAESRRLGELWLAGSGVPSGRRRGRGRRRPR
jgi:prevent-host-death family protein